MVFKELKGMKKAMYIIGSLLIAITILLVFIFSSNKVPVKQQLKKLNLDNVNKVMFIAHPDDETIWGGVHLLQEDYLVVCVTCGNNKTRVKEIQKTMDYSNDKLIMLGYPDKIWGKRSDWKYEMKDIKKDIKKILKAKDWQLVVTHNPEGEYGHKHHKMTSNIVTEIYGKQESLYYFGKYYQKQQLKKINKPSTLDKKLLKEKTKTMLPIYKSQGFIKKKFGHMYPYEDWIKSTDWK